MSSFYSDASLIVIPSGYKASKVYSAVPTDGSGDLTFTRSNDTATRVNSAGLIEEVRTNLNLYSEQMDNAYYTKTTGTTVTANNAANPIDGALTADTINYDGTGTSGNYRIYSSPVLTSISGYEYTWSVWLRCATPTTFILSNNRALTSVNVTSTWQRFSVTGIGNGSSSIQTLIYSNSGNNSPFALEVFGQQVELGVMTDYIPTTTAAVSVGPVANVPRLDYLGSTCPRLLLEPQRTNLATYSEQFDNAGWSKTNTTVTANNAVSPDGYTNSDKIVANTTNGIHNVNQPVTVGTSTAYTASIYAKKGEYSGLRINFISSANTFVSVNLNTGVIQSSGGSIYLSSSITSVGNDWYRITMSFLPPIIGSSLNFIIENPVGTTSFAGDNTSGIFLWGAQLEVGAYATSYIPTLGASVTRGADACSKTGISSLIGQTEGTLFVDLNYETISALSMFLSIRPNPTNKIEVYRDGQTIYGDILGNSVSVLLSKSANPAGRYKIALAYKSGETSLYINGTSVGTSVTAFSFATSMADLFINLRSGPTFVEQAFYNQAIVFTTRLPNSELASLTTL